MANRERLPSSLLFFTVVAAVAWALPAPLDGQTRSLTWTTTTQTELPGALGHALRVTGVTAPIVRHSELHVRDGVLIEGNEVVTQVIDLNEGRWTTIDHRSRTYFTFTLEEAAEFTREAINELSAAIEAMEEDPDGPFSAEALEENERLMNEMMDELEFRTSVESTGERQTIGSHDAGRHFVTATLEAAGEMEAIDEPSGGSLVFFEEVWLTTDVPSPDDLREAWALRVAEDPRFRALGEEVMALEDGGPLAATLASAAPQMGVGILALEEASANLEGFPIRRTTMAASVRPGATLDREELLAWEPPPLPGVGDVARGAASGALRGLARSVLGGRGQQQQQEEEEPNVRISDRDVRPLMRSNISRDNIVYRESGDDILAEIYERIADYERQTIESRRRQ